MVVGITGVLAAVGIVAAIFARSHLTRATQPERGPATSVAALTFGAPAILRAQPASLKIGILHPVTGGLAYEGEQCRKGALLDEILDTPDRLLYPQIRESLDQPFRRVSWDVAASATSSSASCRSCRGPRRW